VTNSVVVAAFDFDGTICKGDSLMPFLLRLLGGRRVARSVLRHATQLGLVSIGQADRDLVKEKFIAHILSGHPAEQIHAIGKEFAMDMIRTRVFDSARQKIAWHREQGHRLVMVSATLDVYLEPFCEQFGFDELLCTKLEIVDGKATGRLVGVNVRAAEKARQLTELIDVDHVELWAYGNSSGDYDMLRLARHPFFVDRSGNFSPWKQS
jgi:phosphatidylglycerophosphatase C